MRFSPLATLRLGAAAAVIAALAALAAPASAQGDLIRVRSDAATPETVARLTAAVEAAGATVFATIDHQAGAETAGVALAPMTLVILGNPRIGAPAMKDAPTMGLDVPLRVLVFEDADGATYLAYRDPAEVARGHGLAPDHPAVLRMRGALGKLTGKAAGG